MTKPAAVRDAPEPRPYHHGDLRRALIGAARAVLEREGPQALSLRAVAREAGVSPAAPYHHFKDKGDLLGAVAEEGFADLALTMERARDSVDKNRHLTALGVAYVLFARANPALYRVMYDSARDDEALPGGAEHAEDGAFCMVRDALIRQRGYTPADAEQIEYACIAAWCVAHGLAELAGFKQFEPLKAQAGGDGAFFEAVLKHVGLFHP